MIDLDIFVFTLKCVVSVIIISLVIWGMIKDKKKEKLEV